MSSRTQERSTFGLTDDLIRAAFKALGVNVSNVYVREPTPGNLYDNARAWPPGESPPQTQVHLVAASAKIVDFSVKPEIVAHKLFENDSKVQGTFSGGISTTVQNTVTNTWSQANSVTVSAEIGFNVGVVNGKVGFSFTHDWSWGGSESQTVGLGSSDNISVVLGPGQKVDAQLESCSRRPDGGGRLPGNRRPRRLGHRRKPDALLVRFTCGRRQNLQRITQTVTVGYYSNDSIRLVDPTTNEVTALPRATSLPTPAT